MDNDIIDKEYDTVELFELLDVYMDKYYKFYTTSLESDKNDCKEYTIKIHEILTKDFNILKIAEDMSQFIDKYFVKTNNIDYIIIAIEYLLNDHIFDVLLNVSLDMFDDHIKSTYHYSLTMLILNRNMLYNKYVEEIDLCSDDDDIDQNEIKKVFLETKMASVIKIIKNIYNNLSLLASKDEYYIPFKENLMELLCVFDLEIIYAHEDILSE